MPTVTHRPDRETLKFVQVTGQPLLIWMAHRHPTLEHGLPRKAKASRRDWTSEEELHDHQHAARDVAIRHAHHDGRTSVVPPRLCCGRVMLFPVPISPDQGSVRDALSVPRRPLGAA